jgi:hypothetical protein
MRRALAVGAPLVLSLAVAPASAQRVRSDRAAVLVTGAPAAGARVDRVDVTRTGFSTTPLPASNLRTAWHASLGIAIEQGPIVDAQDTTYVAGSRGEVVALGSSGEERWRVSTGSIEPGPLALLSDESLVFVDAGGDAVAVRQGAVRWRAHVGRGGTVRPAPLPLDDGGVVVATAHELALIDAEGGTRSRVVLGEPATGALVAAPGGVVLALGAMGTVWAWEPGAAEVNRVGTLDAPPDGAAVLVRPRTLIAVGGRQGRLLTLELDQTLPVARDAAPGLVWLGPPAVGRGVIVVQAITAAGELAVAVHPSGVELGRAAIALRPAMPKATASATADAGASGAAGFFIPPHTAPLVDARGTVAFATTLGALGVVAGLVGSSPVVELVVDACPPVVSSVSSTTASGRTVPAVTGLAPLAHEAGFVATCASGTVLSVHGSEPRGRDLPSRGESHVPTGSTITGER